MNITGDIQAQLEQRIIEHATESRATHLVLDQALTVIKRLLAAREIDAARIAELEANR